MEVLNTISQIRSSPEPMLRPAKVMPFSRIKVAFIFCITPFVPKLSVRL